MRLVTAVALAFLLLLPFACSSDGPVEPPASEGPQSLAIQPVTDTLNAVGDTLVLSATVADGSGNTVSDVAINWKSMDEAIATVYAEGRTVSVAEGTVGIVAASSGLADTATIVVRQAVASITVNPVADTLVAGDSLELIATVSDSNAVEIADVSLSWASSDESVASVDTDGAVKGQLAGTATITVTAEGVDGTADITVVPGAPDTLYAHGGDGQTGPAGEPLADSLSVRVTDAFGNPVSDVTVRFTAGSGSGSVSPASTATNGAGIAKTEWTPGDHAGTDSVEVTSPDLSSAPILFTATATPNGTITGTLTLTNALGTEAVTLASATNPRGAPTASADIRDGGSGPLSLTGDGSTQLKQLSSPEGSGTTDRVVGQHLKYVPGSLIVTYRTERLGAPPAGAGAYSHSATARAVASDLRKRLDAHAANRRFDVRGVSPAIGAARIRVEPHRLDEVRTALLRDPAVAAVERERLVYEFRVNQVEPTRPATAVTPNDPAYRPQMWHYNLIDLPEAWNQTTGNRSIVVAVVDDGIRFDHPSVAANLTNDGYDFVSNNTVDICGTSARNAGDGDGYDADPTIPVKFNTSTCGYGVAHGLHVAGTVGAAGNDGVGVTGVNWSVSIRPVRVLGINGSGSLYDIAQGILYAAGLPADNGAGGMVQAPSGANIINLSLGSPTSSTDLKNAVEAAANAGSLLVAAAGNDATSDPNYPAAYPEVVSVSAVGPDRKLASYSNYGTTIDIAAPGGDQSDGDETYGIASTLWDFDASQPTAGFLQGTSMAAPHVSGVAALLLADDPSLTADQLRDRLLDYAVDLGTTGRDDSYGYGLVNARNSLTQTLAPTRDLYARLYDATTGRILSTVPADPDGSYTFSELADGSYYVFAGRDDEGDQEVGVPGRRWGAYGSGTGSPTAVEVSGAGTYPASFAVGWPSEVEPNNALAEANKLVLGGYLYAAFSSASDVDVYHITVPAGTYTFETVGWRGACWYAGDVNTVLELYDSAGSLVASNDDIDADGYDYCSRITQTLPAGTYEIRAIYAGGGGLYRVVARAGT